MVRISSLKHIDYYSAIHGSIPLNYCIRRNTSGGIGLLPILVTDLLTCLCSSWASTIESTSVLRASTWAAESRRHARVVNVKDFIFEPNFLSLIISLVVFTPPHFEAICFETQKFSNTPNISKFPSTLIKAGELYNQKTHYTFSLKTVLQSESTT